MSAIEEFKRLLEEAQESSQEAQESSHKLVEQTPVPIVEEENIVQKTARLIRTKNDNTPSAPQDIEAQRWNDPLRNTNFVTQEQMNDHYKLLIQRIQTQLSTVGGGGEVKLRMLDDVDRSSITDGRWLKYDAATRKFVFAEFNAQEPIHNTSLVTTATYTVTENDFYIGVNRAGAVTITLPTSPSSGREMVIKDESGNASANPITVSGNVDNDSEGFVLQIDNGAVSLIYRDGWRII